MIELTDVTKTYTSWESGIPVDVLKGITLSVAPGESIAVVGPSGCGKSTLLNIIGTLDQPTSGSVMLDGIEISGRNDKDLAKIRNEKVGFVFQLHHLLPQLTVLENVLVPSLVVGSDNDSMHRAMSLLKRVGLDQHASSRPSQLSGGQRQRVAVVRALVNQPGILLADEPTGSLDEKSADNIADLLSELNQHDGITMIVVTHSSKLAGRMKKQMVLTDGKLV